ncbi:MAG: hypothetical protein QM817_14930 [Archangium sp.]
MLGFPTQETRTCGLRRLSASEPRAPRASEDPCPLPDGGLQFLSTWQVVLTTGEATIDACLCTGGTGNCAPQAHRSAVVLDGGTLDELKQRLAELRRVDDVCSVDSPRLLIEVDNLTLRAATNSCPFTGGTTASGMWETFEVLVRIAQEN